MDLGAAAEVSKWPTGAEKSTCGSSIVGAATTFGTEAVFRPTSRRIAEKASAPDLPDLHLLRSAPFMPRLQRIEENAREAAGQRSPG